MSEAPIQARRETLLLPAAAGMFLAAYFPTVRWMLERFSAEGSYYSHGPLIPLIGLYFIWHKRKALRSLPRSSSAWGLALMGFAAALHLGAGIIFGINFVSGISLIVMLGGVSLYVWGPAITGALAFPLGFLLFMIPVPQVLLISLTFKMKMLAARIAVAATDALRIPVERAGSVLYLPNGVLTVESECSGINSLISLLALSAVFAYIMEGSFRRRASMVLFAVPVALAANAARIVFLILAAYVYGVNAVRSGVIHYGAGFALWGAAIAMFVMFWRLTAWKRA